MIERTAMIAVLGLAAACASTASTPMVTDRPDFTESATAVAPARLQLEAGATYHEAPGESALSVGETLLRFGVAAGVEARLGGDASIGLDGGPRGMADPSLGVKVELPSPVWIPRLALIAATTLPLGHKDVGADRFVPGAVLAAAWDAGSTGIGANVGYTRLAPGEGEWTASAALGFPLSDRIGAFLESFVLDGPGDPDVFGDAGLTWLVASNLQLDLRAGTTFTSPRITSLGLGFSRRW